MRPDRFRRLREVLSRRQPDLTVLMEGVNKPRNFSAILRNCDAVGVLEAHTIPPPRGLEVNPGTSGGTSKWMEVHRHADLDTAVSHLRDGGFQLVAAHLSPEAVDFRSMDFTRPTALLMGAELDGVSPRALTLADSHVVIPMQGMVHSLNVSVATALLLYEAQRQRMAAGMYDHCRLDEERFRQTLFRWAHPAIAERLDAKGLPLPDLDADGQLIR